MILPLSDAPNPRGVPLVTYLLIGINVAVFVLISWPLSHQRPDPRDPAVAEYVEMIRERLPPQVSPRAALGHLSAYDIFVFKHGFRPAKPEWTDLLTSIFLHGGFLHLFGNMLFLWIYGDNVEYRLGWWRYLFYYLLTGVVATLFYTLFAPGSKLPLVGASGAISGVLGFYFLWFPRNTVRLFVFLFPFFMNVVEVPARLVLGVFLLIDNLLPFLFSGGSGGGGVAHGAHLGGFVAGLAIAWWTKHQEEGVRPDEYRAAPGGPPPLPGASIGQAIHRGELEAAARAYFALPAEQTRRLLSPEDSLALGEWLAAHGHSTAALSVYRRHLRDYPSGPGVAEAHLRAGLLQLKAFGQVAAAYQHLLSALDADPGPEVEAQARAGLQTIADLQKYSMRGFRR